MRESVVRALKKHLALTEKEIHDLVEIPPTSELGDFAFPCFSLSKTLKKSPNDIAQELSKKIQSSDFEKIESHGPYVNFFLDGKKLAEITLNQISKEKEKYGLQIISKEKTLVEFLTPNTNKPLHIGHARNLIFGQAITNILRSCGNKVNTNNLYNDRGVHICKSMVAYEKFGKGDTPKKSKKKADHLVGDYYVKFAQAAKDDPQIEEKAQEYLRKWEEGDKNVLALWKKMNSWAYEGFKETYKKFGLSFDKEYYESEIYQDGKKIILQALKEGLAKKTADGAVVIDLNEYGLGEKVLLRSDGTAIYMTFDLSLAKEKYKDFKFDRSIYITGNEQIYHFQVLFKILEILGYSHVSNLIHLSYGMVNLESGRMKSREGTVVDADDLIEELEGLAKTGLSERNEHLSEKELTHRAEKIAMAALRFYFLKVHHSKDVTFKPEESIQFEGNTGPYLLYTYARSKSILRKVKTSKKAKLTIKNVNEKEKSLIVELSKFPEVVKSAYQELAPNLIANYAYQLSQKFNEFYHSSPVIGSDEETFRLALVDSFCIVLKRSLELLGIEPLEQM